MHLAAADNTSFVKWQESEFERLNAPTSGRSKTDATTLDPRQPSSSRHRRSTSALLGADVKDDCSSDNSPEPNGKAPHDASPIGGFETPLRNSVGVVVGFFPEDGQKDDLEVPTESPIANVLEVMLYTFLHFF